MEAEGTASEEDVPPSTVDDATSDVFDEEGDLKPLSSTGDSNGIALTVAAFAALVSAIAAALASTRRKRG